MFDSTTNSTHANGIIVIIQYLHVALVIHCMFLHYKVKHYTVLS